MLEHRNLKTEYNRYLGTFRDFVEAMEKIEIQGNVNTTVFARLQKLIRDAKDIPSFVKKISIDYSANVDEKLEEVVKQIELKDTKNRAMFSSDTEEKILSQIKN